MEDSITMINLFIDSNIWLSLYHFTSDDLTQFGKLKNYIGSSVKLLIPQQVCDEVLRNREVKLKDALKSFNMGDISFPAFCKEYKEYESFSRDYKSLKQRFDKWKQTINEDIKKKHLPADELIEGLFAMSEIIPCEEYVGKAYMRFNVGNPPGKGNSYGDAINWECLLDVVPNGEDIYIVSSDKDYRSLLFDSMLNPFLSNEWKRNKGGNVFFYTKLVFFLSKHLTDIKLKADFDKDSTLQ